ncbi:hypothetical protein CAL65_19350 [Alkalilimnicola ehrlichii]|uniref:TonB-dependent transporter Oar-like beta-barrel domain-containing protein n=1 Tax=Alkalilimnicola ehrlichii TaxID=351052 RepID=A0A3E0WKK4_9GAMM|nr:hypothetical protein CAL65_19350 [Alkalilimnicola ehrlichii]
MGHALSRQGRRNHFSSTDLEGLPRGDGGLSRVLRLAPGVQTGQRAGSADRAGEIDPERISISGSRFYQNRFQIDGFANDSLLDPGWDRVTVPYDTPGHQNRQFLPSHLIDSVTVRDSNIRVTEGGFSGGVVDAETIPAAAEPTGRISFGGQRPDWSEFSRNQAGPAANEPSFSKWEGSFLYSGPLSDNARGLISLSRLESRVDYASNQEDGRTATERNQSDSLFGKLEYDLANNGLLELSTIHAPYEATDFAAPNNYDPSDVTLHHQNISTGLNSRLTLPTTEGVLELRVGVHRSENRRRSDSNRFNWAAVDSKADCTAGSFCTEGGFGNIDKYEQGIESHSAFTLNPIEWGNTHHALTIGSELGYTQARFDVEESVNYTRSSRSSVGSGDIPDACAANDPACIEGEQFIEGRTFTPDSSTTASQAHVALFLEDEIAVGRWLLRAGLRYDYNGLLDNHDFAPRLYGRYDLFGDRRTTLKAGAARYYGRSFLGFKLREGRNPIYNEERELENGTPGEWTRTGEAFPNFRFDSNLRTPYSDEYTLGVEQRLGRAGLIDLQYVARRYRDEFLRDDSIGEDNRLDSPITNNGQTDYQSVRLNWRGHWGNRSVLANVTWQDTRSGDVSYDPNFGEQTENVVFDGDVIHRSELPRQDYNRPWEANLAYLHRWPSLHLHGSVVLQYVAGYDRVVSQWGADPETGLDVFTEERVNDVATVDLAVSWRPPLGERINLQIDAEVLSLFNNRQAPEDQYSPFELGRQYWLSSTLHF